MLLDKYTFHVFLDIEAVYFMILLCPAAVTEVWGHYFISEL